MMSRKVSIAEARRDFSEVLKQARESPVLITRRGKPEAVILAYDEYQQLRRLRAYTSMLRLAKELHEAGVTASDLYEASRKELEGRGWS